MTLDKQHVKPVRVYYRESDSSPMVEVNSTSPLPVTSGSGSSSAFGEQIVAEPTPVVQVANKYQIDPANRDDLETFEATGGSADNDGNLFRCQTGTSIGGYGVVRSKEAIIYRAGEGVRGLFTAAFTTGIANSLQFGGLFNLTETIAFGYDGANFSALYSHNGDAEVQTLQVTTAATTSESPVITLDDDTFTANLTNTTVQGNAFEIARDAAADATIAGKWRVEQADDTVYFIAKAAEVRAGLSSFPFGGTAAATFATPQNGTAKTDAHTAQADWNVTTSPFDDFDPTKINIYKIEYGYLGVANINYSIYDPNTGQFVLVHRGKFANVNTATHLGSPDLKVGWTAASLGSSGTNLTVTGGSGQIAVEGQRILAGSSFAADNSVSSVSTTLTNILTIKNRIVYGDRFNLGKIIPISASLDNDHNKGAIVELRINATLGGTPNYQYEDEYNSLGLVDKAATTVTDGTLVDAFTVPAGGDATVDLSKLSDILNPEDTLTLAAKTISGTSTAMTGALVWKEEK